MLRHIQNQAALHSPHATHRNRFVSDLACQERVRLISRQSCNNQEKQDQTAGRRHRSATLILARPTYVDGTPWRLSHLDAQYDLIEVVASWLADTKNFPAAGRCETKRGDLPSWPAADMGEEAIGKQHSTRRRIYISLLRSAKISRPTTRGGLRSYNSQEALGTTPSA